MNKLTKVIYGDSETNSDLYYASGFLVPDAVFYFDHKNKKYLILNDLEIDRGKKESDVDHIISMTDLAGEYHRATKKPGNLNEWAVYFLQKKLKTKNLLLPKNFPAEIAFLFKKKGLSVQFGEDPFYQERMIKTQQEKKYIHQTQSIIGEAIMHAYAVLKKSKIKGSRIYYQGEVLTSERLRSVVDNYLFTHNCLPVHTIVASGNQAVDPHCRGTGPIVANSAIIFDVFPHHTGTRYFGDMSRTVVKGRASDAIKKQWHAVRDAQEWGIKQVKAGVNVRSIHHGILQQFDLAGFKTGKRKGRMQGFFHGTGHGVGLDIHEAPRVGSRDYQLRAGEVVTVEPGLYYHGVGGVRIEDIVYVKPTGNELLGNRCPKILEIP